jgi:hypothetical protein
MERQEFKTAEVEELLVHCHRRCCVCHKYCGVKIEIDHIKSATTTNSGDISNAIALSCHYCILEVFGDPCEDSVCDGAFELNIC